MVGVQVDADLHDPGVDVDGVHVLRPVGLPVEVRRRREGDQLVWDYVGFTARLDKIGDADADPGATIDELEATAPEAN